jgi:pilus assembly protein Flp/PilA
MIIRLRKSLRRDEGASAVEYALIVAAIAAIIVAVVFLLGTRTKSMYSQTNSCLSAGSPPPC